MKILIPLASTLLLAACVSAPPRMEVPLQAQAPAPMGMEGPSSIGYNIIDSRHSNYANQPNEVNNALWGGAIGAGVGGYMDYQEKKLRESLANTGVDVERNGNQIKLVMPENVTFPTNSSTLNANAQNALAAAAQTLTQYHDTTLTINGHTDNTGNDAINEPLSRNRAESVATFLQSRGVSSTRLSTFGYGSRQPISSNATVEGRAQNRRASRHFIRNPRRQIHHV